MFRWAKKFIYPQDFVRDAGRGLVKRYYQLVRSEPTKIADLEWDNLIVLDACRYDAFEHENDINGQLHKITSAGTHTTEWLYRNFKRRRMKDTVYVSANPFASNYCLRHGPPRVPQFKIGYNPFYRIIEVWKDGWNEKLGTVHPSEVNKAVVESRRMFRDKKMIIHYLQPHRPFIGKVRIEGTWGFPIETFMKPDQSARPVKHEWSVWKSHKELRLEVIRAYVYNLRLVLQYVKRLLPHLAGKTFITSDHGTLFGEHGFIMHPIGVYCPELVSVPLLEVAQNEA